MDPDKALELLKEGNKQYIEGTINDAEININTRRKSIEEGQSPFAVILGCSDSRVPAELVFNQGLGDLFVVRVAGNIIAASQIGSIEFACQNFGSRLIVVLGHSHCGAIKATVDSLLNTPGDISPNIASIVEELLPAVRPVVEERKSDNTDQLVHQAMRANIEQSVNGLETRSTVLSDMVNSKQIKIVGAEYCLETGVVDFYDS